MTVRMDALVAAVRKAALPRVWSVGVTLARGHRVALERRAGSELTVRVSAPQAPVPFVVLLDVEDVGWSCDCPSREDPCAHVCAAVIALEQAERSDAPIEVSARPKLAVEHTLRVEADGLAVERAWVDLAAPDAPRVPLTEPIELTVNKRRAEVDFQLGDVEVKVERLLARQRKGRLDATATRELITLLQGRGRVRLDERTVGVDAAPLLPRGRVFGDRRELIFIVEADPTLERVLVPGLALAGGALRPLGEANLAGWRWENLPIVQRFPRDRWPELVAEVVPLMEARFPIVVETSVMPALARGIAPRIELGMRVERGRMTIAPELVYGRPPQLRIENKRAIYLEGAVPRRDQAAEQRLLTRLRDELNLVTGRRVEYVGPDAQSFLQKLKRWNDASDDSAEQFDLEIRGAPLVPRLVVEGERFDVLFEAERTLGEGGGRADPRAVVEAWLSGFGEVPLLDGGFAPLPVDWLSKHGHQLLALLEARDERGALPTALLPDLARLADALDAPAPPGLDRLRPLLEDFTRLPAAPLPSDLTAQLRGYQKIGVDWLAFLARAGLGGVLADDMGLGKTLQTICVLERRALVVCPTSVVPNWVSELARFRPGLRVCVFHGPRRSFDRDADVVVTSYPLLRMELNLLAAETWRLVVLDEAQAIKNPDSQAARAAFELRAEQRLSLSGTPLENRLEELWSQLHFTNPGLLGGRREFEQRYAKPIAEGHAARAKELRQRIRPFVLRRLKEEVAPELPPRTDIVLHAELDAHERQVYDAVQLATRAEVIAQLEAGSVLGALEALLRLRQAACHTALVPGQVAQGSSKLDLLVEKLVELVAEGHRALVFSQWTSLLDLAEPALEAAGLRFGRLDGSTVDRAGVVAEFQRADGPSVFLVSLKAGGTGLNLTAADHVFFLDPWWNPAVEQQAADRAHRIGQDRPVFVHRIVAKDTVEEKILVLQEKKRQLAAAALGDAGQAAAITRDDLLALFE